MATINASMIGFDAGSLSQKIDDVKKRLSLKKPVEETKDLIAVHNTNLENILTMLHNNWNDTSI